MSEFYKLKSKARSAHQFIGECEKPLDTNDPEVIGAKSAISKYRSSIAVLVGCILISVGGGTALTVSLMDNQDRVHNVRKSSALVAKSANRMRQLDDAQSHRVGWGAVMRNMTSQLDPEGKTYELARKLSKAMSDPNVTPLTEAGKERQDSPLFQWLEGHSIPYVRKGEDGGPVLVSPVFWSILEDDSMLGNLTAPLIWFATAAMLERNTVKGTPSEELAELITEDQVWHQNAIGLLNVGLNGGVEWITSLTKHRRSNLLYTLVSTIQVGMKKGGEGYDYFDIKTIEAALIVFCTRMVILEDEYKPKFKDKDWESLLYIVAHPQEFALEVLPFTKESQFSQ
ncbi:hypothetical protein JKY72_00900 [Candidatus Gracilibacteria bacterium]|nr:hypothetical protein [Candidatus Gracilibacteria bacterium]